MKPIHKFNGGKGATLCHNCSVIIIEKLTDDLLCYKCKKLTQEKDMTKRKLINDLNEILNESGVDVYIPETFGFYIGSQGYGGHYEYRFYSTKELAELIIEKNNKINEI